MAMTAENLVDITIRVFAFAAIFAGVYVLLHIVGALLQVAFSWAIDPDRPGVFSRGRR